MTTPQIAPHGMPEKYPLKAAHALVRQLISEMEAFCVTDSCLVAGSVRREKPEVKDLEIVALPLWRPRPDGRLPMGRRRKVLRSDEEENLLHSMWAMRQTRLRWIKAGANADPKESVRPDGLYWRAEVLGAEVWDPETTRPRLLRCDIFLASPANFGKIYMIRTGAARFSEAMFARAKRVGVPQFTGIPYAGDFLTEEEVFAAAGMRFIHPRDRSAETVAEGHEIVNRNGLNR